MIKTDLHIDEFFMKRCLQLAKLGKGHTAPNPLVGAVLVYEGKIIGEGYHQYLGGPHAEVNCINNVSEKDRKFIEAATLYVSLEPCTHFGKTPPCSDLIIQQNIKEVVIGCSDNFKEVNGKGIEKLKAAGVNVKTNVLEIECRKINQHFFLFNEQQRPFIILKWAETKDKKIAIRHGERLFISNEFTNRLVHQWRSETAAILIGTNTALLDNPALNNRLWTGANLVRLLLDMHLRLPTDLNVFNATQKTIVFNIVKHETVDNICYHKINEDEK